MNAPDFTLEQKLAICQHVAKLVRAKLPISGELSKAAERAAPSIADSAKAVDDRIGQGKPLSAILAGDGSRHSRSLAACIECGEKADALDRTLESWSSMHIANGKAEKALRVALLYPTLLVLTMLVSLSYVTWNLIPEYRTTYALFDQQMPGWLLAIVWVREQFGPLIFLLLLLSVAPIAIWHWRRRGIAADGLPREPARRLRLQALAAEMAVHLLRAGIPLSQMASICTRAAGANDGDSEQAFSRLRKQQHIPPLARPASMLLAALHTGLISLDDAIQNLAVLANHLRHQAEIYAVRQTRWIPMLMALTVGTLTILTYVFLIYLPWIWLLQQIMAPKMPTGL